MKKRSVAIRISLAGGAVLLAAGLPACTSGFTDYPNRLIGSDGQLFTLDDLTTIAQDSTLSTDQKRAAFRDLGIDDEQLIDALLTL